MSAATISYKGTTTISVDDKGRITIPTRYREPLRLQCEARLTMTRSPEGCLMLFPRPVWSLHEREIAAWPAKAKVQKMIYLGSAEDMEMDGAGRLLITPDLRKKAGLEKEAAFVGMGSYFEIWDPKRMEAFEEAVTEVPDMVENYVF